MSVIERKKQPCEMAGQCPRKTRRAPALENDKTLEVNVCDTCDEVVNYRIADGKGSQYVTQEKALAVLKKAKRHQEKKEEASVEENKQSVQQEKLDF